MKHLVFLSILFFIGPIPSNLYAGTANVVKLKGKAYVIHDQQENLLKLNSSVSNGEVIRTEPFSFVQLKFKDEGILTIGPKSQIVIEKIDQGKTKLIKILKGQLRSKFLSEKKDKHKLIVRSKSAAMGVRGTEFHIIYNEKNNISTAISYHGNVELSSVNSMTSKNQIFGEDKVYIKEGEFSGVFTENGYVNEPVRFSPKQFAVLKDNTLLNSQPIKKPKNVSRPTAQQNEVEKKISSRFAKDIRQHHKQDGAIPNDLLGDVYRDANHNELALFRPKPGGYIDLNTGIYISPPEGSRYDPKEDLYYPPDGHGSINEITGEYIPPFGLILHPLNGFIVASSAVEKGMKNVREGVTTVGKYLWSGIKKAGSAVMDGANTVGETVVDNTGAPGKAVSKGVGTVKNMVIDTVGGASDIISTSTGKTVAFVADSMNTYLYEGLLKPIGGVIKKTPILSSLQLRLFDEFGYSSAQRFFLYDQITEVVDIPSFHNKLKLIAAYKKFLVKGIFIRPKFNMEKKNYLRDRIPEIHNLNFYALKYGIDLGLYKNFKNASLQTFFFAYKAKVKRFRNDNNEYYKYLEDNIFGFSKAIIGKGILTSRFDYIYTDFNAQSYTGKQHKLSLTEIIKLDKRNFINLDTFWSKRDDFGPNTKTTNFGFKLNYHRYLPFHGLKFNPWGKLVFSKSEAQLQRRGKERITEAGILLSKVFGPYFSTQFEYFISDILSDSDEFDNRSHHLSTKINVSF